MRQTDFSWVRRYPMLVKNVGPMREPVAGYEIAFDYNGLPFELIPRGASQFRSAAKYQLISVNFRGGICEKSGATLGEATRLAVGAGEQRP